MFRWSSATLSVIKPLSKPLPLASHSLPQSTMSLAPDARRYSLVNLLGGIYWGSDLKQTHSATLKSLVVGDHKAIAVFSLESTEGKKGGPLWSTDRKFDKSLAERIKWESVYLNTDDISSGLIPLQTIRAAFELAAKETGVDNTVTDAAYKVKSTVSEGETPKTLTLELEGAPGE
jgi:hypothetical protein